MSSAYPSLSGLMKLGKTSNYYSGLPDEREQLLSSAELPKKSDEPEPAVFAPNAPPLVLKTQPTQQQYRIKGEQRNELKYQLGKHACGVCNEPMDRTADESFMVFGSCMHMAHLTCMIGRLPSKADSSTELLLRGGYESLCARCAEEQLQRRDDIGSHAAHSTRLYRDPDELLAEYKLMYRKKHPNEPSFDQIKDERLSTDEQWELLRVPAAAGPSIASAAGRRFLSAASGFISKVRQQETKYDEVDEDNPANEHEERVLNALDRGTFVQAMLTAKRTFSDIMCSEKGSLLALYRCGVQSLNELRDIGFDPVLHFDKSYRKKVPIWQLYDLYDFRFEHLVGKQHYGMTVRALSECPHIRAAEWALLGATTQLLISMGMQKREMKQFGLHVDQWRRYMMLERAHLTALGINTRHAFVTEMGWSDKDEWCPLQ